MARAGISGNPPTFDQPSDGLHEANLYQGFIPDEYKLDLSLLNIGENVLAIQVHNESLTSSDMTAIPFLSVGINNESYDYRDTPDWFNAPQSSIDFQSSNLPIIIIDTNGSAVVDEPKVNASFKIVFNGEGEINFVLDNPVAFDGYCGIELRGNSSQYFFDKKNYGIEMWDQFGNDVDTSFLNFPAEEDFTLHGPFSDKTLLNNVLAMKLGRDMGHYSSRTRMVEVMLNGDYKGVYVLMEKIKRGKDRVDIAKLNVDEIAGDDLTGGYIFRIDWFDDVANGWDSNYDIYGSDRKLHFNYHTPKPEDMPVQQKDYLRNYVDKFEEAIAAPNFKNAEGKHYTEYINLRSFVDNFILNELSKDVDAYRLSTYFHKDKESKGGKIVAGPFWDFNLAFGNGDYCSGDDPTGWEYYQCVGNSPFWWDRMLNDTTFNNALKCRWEGLRKTSLRTETMNHFLDSMSTSLSEAQERHFQRWPVMGSYIWPNSWFFAQVQNHGEAMYEMKKWIENRSVWLDDNIPGTAQHCDIYENLDNETLLSVEPQETNYSIFPNPAKHVLNISGKEAIIKISFTDLLGNKIIVEKNGSNKISLDLSSFKKGVYLLTIISRKGSFIERVIIE
jgi:hypothetical protein